MCLVIVSYCIHLLPYSILSCKRQYDSVSSSTSRMLPKEEAVGASGVVTICCDSYSMSPISYDEDIITIMVEAFAPNIG